MDRRLLAPFWNREEERVRAPWRLLAQVVVLIVLLLALGQTVGQVLVAAVPDRFEPVAGAVLQTAAVGGSVAVVGHALDRRRLRDFGFRFSRQWYLDLGFGLALGALLMTGVFALELALGWIRVTGVLVGTPATGLSAALLLFVCVGFYEELLSRGYQLTNVAEALRTLGEVPAVAVATVSTAALFGLLHYANPAASVRSSVLVALGGVFLALGYVLTGELAIPVGVHVTWNFFQGAVWGFPVSGLPFRTSVVAVDQRGPALFTGGQFGPEAGLVGLAAVIVGSAAILAYVRWRRGTVGVHPAVTTRDPR